MNSFGLNVRREAVSSPWLRPIRDLPFTVVEYDRYNH